MKNLKIIFRGLILLGVFVVLNSSMCTKEDEENFLDANANGHYFVGVVDKQGARFHAGHVAFFLVSPTEIRFCSANMSPDLHFLATKIESTDFNTLYQILVNQNPDYLDAERILTPLLTDIQRYDEGFYLKISSGDYASMKFFAEKEWEFEVTSNNCVHYFQSILSVANYNANFVNLTFQSPKTDFKNLQNAVGGVHFDKYTEWLAKVAELRR